MSTPKQEICADEAVDALLEIRKAIGRSGKPFQQVDIDNAVRLYCAQLVAGEIEYGLQLRGGTVP